MMHGALITMILEKSRGAWDKIPEEERARRESNLNGMMEIFPGEKEWAEQLKVNIETICRTCGQHFRRN